LAKSKGEPFVVWGSGKPLRQFIYSEDLGALMVWTLEHYEDLSTPIILSVGEEDEVSIAQVAELVAKQMGYTTGLQFDTSKSDGQFKKTASNKKLLSLNPSFKFTPIEEGIKKSVDWFVDNYQTARK
jgi:GDP-L-fucose synthase